MEKILVLGSTGMLGHTLAKVFKGEGFLVTEGNRGGAPTQPENACLRFDANRITEKELSDWASNFDYCINAAGVIRQVIDLESKESVMNAWGVNRDFPLKLASATKGSPLKIVQIGTDCVFSGKLGNYSESQLHDPLDMYGKSKSEGETTQANLLTLRASIVGCELKTQNSLLEWLLNQPSGATIQGFNNHHWNGVTTLHFSKVVLGLIKTNKFVNGNQHLVPQNACSKYELLNYMASSFNRSDLHIEDFKSRHSVNMTLSTEFERQNSQLWKGAGYDHPPTINEMVNEYASWEKIGCRF